MSMIDARGPGAGYREVAGSEPLIMVAGRGSSAGVGRPSGAVITGLVPGAGYCKVPGSELLIMVAGPR